MVSYPLTLQLRGAARPITFRNDGSLLDHCRREAGLWQWLSEIQVPNYWPTPTGNRVQNLFRERIHSRLQGFISTIKENEADSAATVLRNLFSSDGLMHSSSLEGKMVLSIAREMGPQVGLGAAYSAAGFDRPYQATELEAGCIAYWARRASLESNPEVFQRIREAVDDASLVAQRVEKVGDLTRKRMIRSTLRYLRKLRAVRTVISEDIRRERGEVILSIKTVEAEYLQQMKLQAPVTYWNRRAEKHSLGALISGTIGVLYALLAGGALLVWWAPELRSSIREIVREGQSAQFAFVELAVFLVFATIIFWVGRIISRIFLSERHLSTDARERAVMAETYLALAHNGSVSDAERPIVLGSIFRASSDGIVKDDTTPDPSLAALLSRLLMSGSR